jgi:cobalt/nickel transport system permease protein
MHISEGVLDVGICIGGYAAAAGMSAIALRKLRREDVPKVSVMGACFFVSSLIHFRVGITSVHLTLVGLMGIILGLPSVLALMVGLFFQAVMFQHGGLSTLGVNTVVFGLPAWLIYGGFKWFQGRWKRPQRMQSQQRDEVPKGSRKTFALGLAGGFLTMVGIFLAALLVMGVLLLSGGELLGIAYLFSISHILLALVEGVITFAVAQQILRIKPEVLSG